MIPIILFHLTDGGFAETTHFKELIFSLKKMPFPPIIIFTKIEYAMNDIKSRIKNEESELEDEIKPTKAELE